LSHRRTSEGTKKAGQSNAEHRLGARRGGKKGTCRLTTSLNGPRLRIQEGRLRGESLAGVGQRFNIVSASRTRALLIYRETTGGLKIGIFWRCAGLEEVYWRGNGLGLTLAKGTSIKLKSWG